MLDMILPAWLIRGLDACVFCRSETVMQFIEKNSFNVRSAIYHLKKDEDGLEFLLFPMIHVGSKQFYDEVSQRLATCALILAEGVDSKKANLLTLSYRVVKKIRRMDLVTQQEGMKISSFREKLVNTDMKRCAFDEGWSSLPLMLRAQIFLFIPVYVIYLFLFGTRERIAENIALEDLPSSQEILLQDDDFDKLDALLVNERDRRLIHTIEGLHQTNGKDKKIVGILYGAMHMRNVTNFLLQKLNYRIAKAEWVTVFDL
jgi:hypothetical protein